ncbi:hypothetical protein MMC27_002282 [Xylographa pallens]|nr:hypothetical protein [Xylographa pallens]
MRSLPTTAVAASLVLPSYFLPMSTTTITITTTPSAPSPIPIFPHPPPATPHLPHPAPAPCVHFPPLAAQPAASHTTTEKSLICSARDVWANRSTERTDTALPAWTRERPSSERPLALGAEAAALQQEQRGMIWDAKVVGWAAEPDGQAGGVCGELGR